MPRRLTDEERLLRTVTEKHLDEDVRRECKRLSWRRYHTFRSDRSPSGFPDLCLVRECVLFAELKRENASPTPDQVLWLDDLALAGAHVFLWKPSHFTSGEVTRILTFPLETQSMSAWPSRWRVVNRDRGPV